MSGVDEERVYCERPFVVSVMLVIVYGSTKWLAAGKPEANEKPGRKSASTVMSASCCG